MAPMGYCENTAQAPHSGPGSPSDIPCRSSVTDTALRIFILNNAVSPRGS